MLAVNMRFPHTTRMCLTSLQAFGPPHSPHELRYGRALILLPPALSSVCFRWIVWAHCRRAPSVRPRRLLEHGAQQRNQRRRCVLHECFGRKGGTSGNGWVAVDGSISAVLSLLVVVMVASMLVSPRAHLDAIFRPPLLLWF